MSADYKPLGILQGRVTPVIGDQQRKREVLLHALWRGKANGPNGSDANDILRSIAGDLSPTGPVC